MRDQTPPRTCASGSLPTDTPDVWPGSPKKPDGKPRTTPALSCPTPLEAQGTGPALPATLSPRLPTRLGLPSTLGLLWCTLGRLASPALPHPLLSHTGREHPGGLASLDGPRGSGVRGCASGGWAALQGEGVQCSLFL